MNMLDLRDAKNKTLFSINDDWVIDRYSCSGEFPTQKNESSLSQILENNVSEEFYCSESRLRNLMKGCEIYGEDNMPKRVKDLIEDYLQKKFSNVDIEPRIFHVRRGKPDGGGKGYLESNICPTLSTTNIIVLYYAKKGERIIFRRLTPTEYQRLQGFPDLWAKNVPHYTKSNEYKLWGNGVSLPCVNYIIHRIATEAL